MKRETYVAKVLDNVDPAKAGGVRAQATDLVDGPLDAETYLPGRFPVAGNDEGFFFAPPKGGQVELEAISDDDEGVEDLAPRWVGMLYSDRDQIPEEFRSNPVDRGGIKWGPSVLLLDRGAELLGLVAPNVRLGEEAAPHPVLRGDTFNAELDAFLAAVETFATAIAAIPAHAGPAGALKTAATLFRGKLSTWLSTKVKTE